MKYVFKAKKGPGEIVEGTLEMPNKESAVAHIIREGLVPVLVEEEGQYRGKGKRLAGISSTRLFPRKISKTSVHVFTKQLRTLLRSQVSILNSLYIAQSQTADRAFREVISGMIRSVKDGASFSESLSVFPDIFPPLYISITRAGEASGKLDHALTQSSDYLERNRSLAQTVL